MMKNKILLSFIICALFCSFEVQAQQPDIELQPIASGFHMVTDISNAGDSRLFVTEQPGLIMILNEDGTTHSVPFLDIRNRVDTSHNEQGLLGLTFHPDYKNNGYFYVNYTAVPNGATHISRFSVTPGDSNLADTASEMIILSQSQPYGNHNAGDLNFGPDGYLYFGLGDGGSAGDPQDNAQDGSVLLGKMIRIDVDGASPYQIPLSNPFVGDPNVLDEIWAMGLRNPFRFSFDRLTNDMWIADVGQYDWEEINMEPASGNGGMNWGWDCYEGDSIFEPAGCLPASNYDFPVFVYPNNSIWGCAVLGGFVYRGSMYPNLEGHYIFTDLCSGRIWTLYSDGAGGWDTTDQGSKTGNSFTTLGEGADGEIYISERTGSLFRITDKTGTSIERPDPPGFRLHATVPNPFKDLTRIGYELSKAMHVRITIYDMHGRRIKNLINRGQSAGSHQVSWNGANEEGISVQSGNYLVVMKADGYSTSQSILLFR